MSERPAPGLAGDYRAVPDGLMLVLVIVGWSVAIDAVAWRWPRLGAILKPSPKPLVEDGRVNMSQLRLHGEVDLPQLQAAV